MRVALKNIETTMVESLEVLLAACSQTCLQQLEEQRQELLGAHADAAALAQPTTPEVEKEEPTVRPRSASMDDDKKASPPKPIQEPMVGRARPKPLDQLQQVATPMVAGGRQQAVVATPMVHSKSDEGAPMVKSMSDGGLSDALEALESVSGKMKAGEDSNHDKEELKRLAPKGENLKII